MASVVLWDLVLFMRKQRDDNDRMLTMFKTLINDDRVSQTVMCGRTLAFFDDMNKTSPIEGIRRAFNLCWRVHDWGRIPMLKKLMYKIVTSNDSAHTLPMWQPSANDMDKEFAAWRWLRVDHCSQYELDLSVAGGDRNFFAISGQTPAALIGRLVYPVVVMPFEDYANNRRRWEDSGMIVVYPVTTWIRRKIVPDWRAQDEVRCIRKIRWVAGPSRSLIDLFDQEPRDNNYIVRNMRKFDSEFFAYIGHGPTRRENVITIPFVAMFDTANGEIKEDIFEYARDQFQLDDQICRWIKNEQSLLNCCIMGMWVPDFRDRRSKPIENLSPRNMEELELIYAVSYLNIGEATFGDGTTYKQKSFDFAVGSTSYFRSARVQLKGNLWFENDPAVAIYSLNAYAPDQSVTRPTQDYMVNILPAPGTDENEGVVLYPSD